MPARPDAVADLLELGQRARQRSGVQLGDLAAVPLGERLGARLRLVEQRDRALVALALDQRLEIPAGGLERLVGRARRSSSGSPPTRYAAADPGIRGPRASDNVRRRWARCESSRAATASCSRRSITRRTGSWTTGWSTGLSGWSSARSPIPTSPASCSPARIRSASSPTTTSPSCSPPRARRRASAARRRAPRSPRSAPCAACPGDRRRWRARPPRASTPPSASARCCCASTARARCSSRRSTARRWAVAASWRSPATCG